MIDARVSAIFVLLLLAHAGMASDKTVTGAFPKEMKGMQGWHGVKIKKGVNADGGPLCQIEFPAAFGQDPNERALLVYLVTQNPKVNAGLECEVFPEAAYGALDRLLYMATAKQDINAAGIIIDMGLPSIPFNLDGEMAELYAPSYLMPLLEKAANPCAFTVGAARQRIIAQEICAEVQFRVDSGQDDILRRTKAMARRLRACGSTELARVILGCSAGDAR